MFSQLWVVPAGFPTMAPKKAAEEPPPPAAGEDAGDLARAKEEERRRSNEEYTKYIVESGVANELTRIIVGLYESGERPTNAEEWLRKYLSAPAGVDVEELRAENAELKRKQALLEESCMRLSAEVAEAEERAAALAAAEED